jgi:uncharacterized membrane protein
MKRKKLIIWILIGLLIVVTIATIITYFVLATDRPWLAFYFACCGGILDLNFLITLFLINKNFK